MSLVRLDGTAVTAWRRASWLWRRREGALCKHCRGAQVACWAAVGRALRGLHELAQGA